MLVTLQKFDIWLCLLTRDHACGCGTQLCCLLSSHSVSRLMHIAASAKIKLLEVP